MPTVGRLLSTGILRANTFDEFSGTSSNIGLTTSGTFYASELIEGDSSLISSIPMRFTSDKKLLVYNSFDEVTGIGVDLYDNIGGLAAYMTGFMSEYRNPSFYSYNLDGDATYIVDGGLDMYDNGNFTTPWLIAGTNYTSSAGTPASYPSRILYSNTTATLVDTSFRYASLGYGASPDKRPLTVIGTRTGVGNPIGWQKGGNSGADGGGTLASGFVYNGTTVNGFTVYSYIRQTYNATDPSHCDLYILLGHPSWDSSFGIINNFAAAVNLGSNGGYLFTSGAGVKNILAIATLLSKSGGAQVTNAECQTVTDNIINRVKLYFGF
jgi:hypothetical protein